MSTEREKKENERREEFGVFFDKFVKENDIPKHNQVALYNAFLRNLYWNFCEKDKYENGKLVPNPDYRKDYENVSYISLIASLTDKQIKDFRLIGPGKLKYALALRDAAKAKIEKESRWYENTTRPVIITLCGSERNAELFDVAEEYLQEFFYYQHGAIVMRPVPLKIRRNMKIETHHEVHDLKMKQSDAVIVVDGLLEKGSYFGRDTQREIAFAKKNKIPVYFFHKVLINGFRE